jgi:choline dehydrogenase-like flavoprotein
MSGPLYDAIVLGSGASGAMAASVLVKRGWTVLMVDGGIDDARYRQIIPDRSFSEIRRTDAQQARYFLGDDLEGIPKEGVKVGAQLTPPRQFIHQDTDSLHLPFESDSFFPMQTLALGGLGAGWGAACFAFDSEELRRVGIPAEGFTRYYDEVAREIGVSADLSSELAPLTLPGLTESQPPLEIDENAQAILNRWRATQNGFRKEGLTLGAPALAVLSRDLGNRKANPYFDMDFWSDSRRSVYRPRYTVEELEREANFQRASGLLAESFEETPQSVILHCRNLRDGARVQFQGKRLFLCAGALGSARVALASTGNVARETSLLCNPYTYMPCLNLSRLGRKNSERRHSLSQLCGLYLPPGSQDAAVSLQFYSYESLLLFKLVKEAPLPAWAGLLVMRALMSSLTIVGVHHADSPSPGKTVKWIPGDSGQNSKLSFRYEMADDQVSQRHENEKRLQRHLLRLGCLPMGRIDPGSASSIHYAGTIPNRMGESSAFGCDSNGRMNGMTRVYVADSSSWNYLPAKGLTFTLMANARRVAEEVWKADSGEAT